MNGVNKIRVEIFKGKENYCCGWEHKSIGAILCTNKTLRGLKHDFEESLRWHIEECVEDGDDVPNWLTSENYSIEYVY